MLDFTFLFILLFATLLGFFRGFVKEFFGFCCLLASVFLAFYHYDLFLNLFEINHGPVVSVVSGVAVFIVCMILSLLFNGWFMYALKPIRLGMFDRSFGVLFGAFKGIFFCYLVFAVLNVFYYSLTSNQDLAKQSERDFYLPNWIKSTRSYNALSYIDDFFNYLLPVDYCKKIRLFGESFALKIESDKFRMADSKNMDKEKH